MDPDRRWLRHCHKKSRSWRGLCEGLRLASTGKLTPNGEGHQGAETQGMRGGRGGRGAPTVSVWIRPFP